MKTPNVSFVRADAAGKSGHATCQQNTDCKTNGLITVLKGTTWYGAICASCDNVHKGDAKKSFILNRFHYILPKYICVPGYNVVRCKPGVAVPPSTGLIGSTVGGPVATFSFLHLVSSLHLAQNVLCHQSVYPQVF